MRQVHEADILEELEFARRAAERFAADPELYSYTEKDIVPGAFLALRWGLGKDCVAVLKLDELHAPTIYTQQIPRAATNTKDTQS